MSAGSQPSGTVESLLQLPEAMREFLTHLPAVVYQCGPPPSFPTTFVSDNVEGQLAYKPEEFYADPFFWTKHLHETDRHRVLAELAALGDRDRITYEYRFRRSDGEYAWLHDQVSVLRDDHLHVRGVIGGWFDVSDRKRMEMLLSGQALILDHLVKRRSLQESLEQVVRFLENQNPGMVCSVLRFDSATQTLCHGAAPSLPDAYNRKLDGIKIGPTVGSCGTAAHRRKRIVVTDIETDPLWAGYRELAATCGLRACWSQPIFSSSNHLLGTFAMYYHEPRGPTQGELRLIEQAAGLAAIAIERYREEELMRHTERLASLGTLAAGIAHEINNPIGGIQLAAQVAVDALARGDADRVRSMLDSISTDTARCARIVRGVLQFGRQSDSTKRPVRLAEIAETACELTRGYAAKRRATVEFSSGEAGGEVLGRAVELEQVFVNLIRNGIESRDQGARVTVHADIDQDVARISVSDDGRGMNDEQKERIFDPFFTTRQNEGGTGLGMSIVHGIVKGHGGTIHIESNPQRGTTVVVCLPRHE